jgi:hypothetical protein
MDIMIHKLDALKPIVADIRIMSQLPRDWQKYNYFVNNRSLASKQLYS